MPGEPPPSEALLAIGKLPPQFSADCSARDEIALDVESKRKVLQTLWSRAEDLRRQWCLYNSYEEVLACGMTPSTELDEVQAEVGHRLKLWETAQCGKEVTGGSALRPCGRDMVYPRIDLDARLAHIPPYTSGAT